MFESLLIPFQYEYMLKAIFASACIGGVCACLSCFVVLKGWSLMGDALAHSIVPGVSVAYLIGIPFSIGAFISGILATACMGFVKSNTRIKEDAAIGIVFTTFFAAGLLLISLYPSNINLKNIIFGNILGIANYDLAQMLAISVVTLLVVLCKWKDLVLYLFDENHARSLGINVFVLHGVLLSLIAATAVAALQAVGVCLVVAMLVTPGATAYLLTDKFKTMMALAVSIGVGSACIGAYLSYFLNGSTGGSIVVLQTVVFLGALVFAPKHGLAATKAIAARATKRYMEEGRDPFVHLSKRRL